MRGTQRRRSSLLPPVPTHSTVPPRSIHPLSILQWVLLSLVLASLKVLLLLAVFRILKFQFPPTTQSPTFALTGSILSLLLVIPSSPTHALLSITRSSTLVLRTGNIRLTHRLTRRLILTALTYIDFSTIVLLIDSCIDSTVCSRVFSSSRFSGHGSLTL